LKDDIDINAGIILEGSSLEDVGEHLINLVKRVINGEQTQAEENGQTGSLCLYTQSTSF
jgi:altronate dehydratase large subunit